MEQLQMGKLEMGRDLVQNADLTKHMVKNNFLA